MGDRKMINVPESVRDYFKKGDKVEVEKVE